MVVGNIIGGHPISPKTIILQTEDGQQIPGILVDQETVFTAGTNDVRVGKVFATDTGVKTGEKVIPAYHVSEGTRLITAGSEYYIPFQDDLEYYDYTKLQAIICTFNANISDSVAAVRVAINDNVYDVNSTSSISVINKDENTKEIRFGAVNNSGSPQLLRYFSYKEIP